MVALPLNILKPLCCTLLKGEFMCVNYVLVKTERDREREGKVGGRGGRKEKKRASSSLHPTCPPTPAPDLPAAPSHPLPGGPVTLLPPSRLVGKGRHTKQLW